MTHIFDGYNYIIRLEKGELIVEKLQQFAHESELKGGFVFGLGGLAWAELGFYDLDEKEYDWTRLDEPLELASLTGNIAWSDNEPVLHLHATVSGADLVAKAGHLKEAETSGTVELFIHRWQNPVGLSRSLDQKTGLNLLDL